jgi:hypothetical protein
MSSNKRDNILVQLINTLNHNKKETNNTTDKR